MRTLKQARELLAQIGTAGGDNAALAHAGVELARSVVAAAARPPLEDLEDAAGFARNSGKLARSMSRGDLDGLGDEDAVAFVAWGAAPRRAPAAIFPWLDRRPRTIELSRAGDGHPRVELRPTGGELSTDLDLEDHIIEVLAARLGDREGELAMLSTRINVLAGELKRAREELGRQARELAAARDGLDPAGLRELTAGALAALDIRGPMGQGISEAEAGDLARRAVAVARAALRELQAEG